MMQITLLTIPFVLLASLVTLSCENKEESATAATRFDEGRLLRTMADDVIRPAYDDALTTATALKAATAGWAASPRDVTARTEAQAAWKLAMSAWQRAELFQVGPAGPAGVAPGGLGLRDTIYSWPSVNPCRVDQEIVANNFADDGFFESALVNVGGLDAIEYLSFYTGATNQCPNQVDINAQGTWDALSASELAKRRAGYADAAAAYLVMQTKLLRDTWVNGFADKFAAGAEPYSDRGEAIDDLIRAVFYLELTTKDEKLAQPLGIQGTCSTNACPEKLESQWAHVSGNNVLQNLVAFRSAFTGEGQYGIGSALDDLGESAYADETLADIDAAIATYQTLPNTLRELLLKDRATVQSAYEDLKTVTDRLKGRLLTALELRIPQEGGGDTD